MKRLNAAWRTALTGLLAALAAVLALGWYRGALHGPQNALVHEDLPYYADPSLQPRWDTWASWQRVGRFALVDQHARPLGTEQLVRGPTVVGFFYAGCVSVCPVSVALLRGLRDSLATAVAAPQVLLISTNPREDSPALLARYAQRMALPADWLLATGEPAAVRTLAHRQLLTAWSEPVAGETPPHANRAFLLDRQRRIRGVYDASQPLEMQRLRGDYLRLLAQPGA